MRRWKVTTPEQAERLVGYISRELASGPQTVSVEPWKPPKTSDQLAKVHALIGDFARSQDRDPEDMKALLKFHLGFTKQIAMSNGKVREIPRSFSDASKEELSEIITRLELLAMEYGVELRG